MFWNVIIIRQHFWTATFDTVVKDYWKNKIVQEFSYILQAKFVLKVEIKGKNQASSYIFILSANKSASEKIPDHLIVHA